MLRTFLAAAGAAVIATTCALAQDKPVIGLIQIDLSNPFHLGEVDGAKEAARRNGFELVVTSGEGDVTKQIQAMENLINQGVDAISINFIDFAAFGPTMAKAAAANIPVICLHSKIEGCAATLGFDERYTGKIVGEYAAELLKARYNGEVKGEVANLQGLLGQGLNTDRSGGFTDVMAQYPGVKVVAQEPTSWDPTKAVSITENWMTAYPEPRPDLRQQRQPDRSRRGRGRARRQAGPSAHRLGRRHRARPHRGQGRRDGEHRPRSPRNIPGSGRPTSPSSSPPRPMTGRRC